MRLYVSSSNSVPQNAAMPFSLYLTMSFKIFELSSNVENCSFHWESG